MKRFVDNLDEQIEFRKTTKAEVARRTGIKPGMITRWRTDNRMPGGPELVAIAKLLDVPPELLLGSDALEILPPQNVRRPGRQPKVPPEGTTKLTLTPTAEPVEAPRRSRPTKRARG